MESRVSSSDSPRYLDTNDASPSPVPSRVGSLEWQRSRASANAANVHRRKLPRRISAHSSWGRCWYLIREGAVRTFGREVPVPPCLQEVVWVSGPVMPTVVDRSAGLNARSLGQGWVRARTRLTRARLESVGWRRYRTSHGSLLGRRRMSADSSSALEGEAGSLVRGRIAPCSSTCEPSSCAWRPNPFGLRSSNLIPRTFRGGVCIGKKRGRIQFQCCRAGAVCG